MMKLAELQQNETLRNELFPVTKDRIFMANAGVAPIPRVGADAIRQYTECAVAGVQEPTWVWSNVLETRKRAASLLGCDAQEVALLGPTSLGLSLVAHGLAWESGDEVVYYDQDYPANVYPWTGLGREGVRAVSVRPESLGAISWDDVKSVLTNRTRLVALASCNFLSGYRIPIETIGQELRQRGILFCLDGIQTVGAFPTPVEHVDFLSADSHKWMLGPVGAGIFFVSERCQQQLRPILRGAWNIESPDFIAQSDIRYEAGARRYEPGTLNIPGILGMSAAMELLLDFGADLVADHLLSLRKALLGPLFELGFHCCGKAVGEKEDLPLHARSAIISVSHPDLDLAPLFQSLLESGTIASLRHNRDGDKFLRFSPHVFNTLDEVNKVVTSLAGHL